GWVHETEGPDDMPAHVKAMLNGVSLHVPVSGGTLALGTWQGIYLGEHRARPHRREVLLQYIGSRRAEYPLRGMSPGSNSAMTDVRRALAQALALTLLLAQARPARTIAAMAAPLANRSPVCSAAW